MKKLLLVAVGIAIGAGAVAAWNALNGSGLWSDQSAETSETRRQPRRRRPVRRRRPAPRRPRAPEPTSAKSEPVRSKTGTTRKKSPERDDSVGAEPVRIGDEVIWTQKVPDESDREAPSADDESAAGRRNSIPTLLERLLDQRLSGRGSGAPTPDRFRNRRGRRRIEPD